MSVQYLVTGATSGLGGSVLRTLLAYAGNSNVVASSSRASAEPQFTEKGIQFRQADYDDSEMLKKAFKGVEKLFFVSSPEHDNEKRSMQHKNVINAAKEIGVGHVSQNLLPYRAFRELSV
jgi:uncharacterized protein YbjT (DUF2867 family)